MLRPKFRKIIVQPSVYLLFYVTYLFLVARLCVRCFCWVSESYAIKQLVTFGEVELLHVRCCRLRGVEHSCRTAQAAGAYSHRPSREDDILAKQSTVNLREIIVIVGCYENDARCIDKEFILSMQALTSFETDCGGICNRGGDAKLTSRDHHIHQHSTHA